MLRTDLSSATSSPTGCSAPCILRLHGDPFARESGAAADKIDPPVRASTWLGGLEAFLHVPRALARRLVAAGLLLAGAMWVRRYRDDTI